MPGNDQPESRSGHPDAPDSRRVSRRSVLGAAGVGAAGLAAGAFGGLASASAATRAKPAAKPASQNQSQNQDDQHDRDEHVVVHVPAGRSGDLDVYHGTSHTRVHDPDLAARLRATTR